MFDARSWSPVISRTGSADGMRAMADGRCLDAHAEDVEEKAVGHRVLLTAVRSARYATTSAVTAQPVERGARGHVAQAGQRRHRLFAHPAVHRLVETSVSSPRFSLTPADPDNAVRRE